MRNKLKLNPQNLAKTAGLSNSYLNEIEKGKKFPKKEKLNALATALKTTVEDLTSDSLPKAYASFELLLKTNVLEELPLELLGIDLRNVVDVLSNSPTKINAFLNTIIEIARNHDLETEYFYFSVLRSYQELKENYFEDIEQHVADFRVFAQLKPTQKLDSTQLKQLLAEHYKYSFDILPDELQKVRSILKKKTLYLNKELNEHQLLFVLGRELAFQFLKLKPRPLATTYFHQASFTEIFNNFLASYFATALLLPKDLMVSDLNVFLTNPRWDAKRFEAMIAALGVSAEMYMHRLTNILPTFFNLKSLFFLRLSSPKDSASFNITKELHLGRLHNPHASSKDLHYCRRWVSVQSIVDLEKNTLNAKASDAIVIDAQISDYYNSKDEYFIISVARPMYPVSGYNTSVSVGILVDKHFKKQVAFSDDASIKRKIVNEACEVCPIADCKERAAEASILVQRAKEKQLHLSINSFLKK